LTTLPLRSFLLAAKHTMMSATQIANWLANANQIAICITSLQTQPVMLYSLGGMCRRDTRLTCRSSSMLLTYLLPRNLPLHRKIQDPPQVVSAAERYRASAPSQHVSRADLVGTNRQGSRE